ncbi:MAG: nucleoside triphosphate pyrophosphohydrolase family protein [Pseudonocardia sp.]
MELIEYQRQAARTVQRAGDELADVAVHLLGLLGEAGSVATEYKKRLRDGEAHLAWKAKFREELGDVLWYVAALATSHRLDLDDIARANLEKTRDRWLPTRTEPLDEAYLEHERLPRSATLEFVTALDQAGRPTAQIQWEGRWCGDPLTDASHVEDGYRFHDVLHLAHAAVLGWSPVTRKLLGRKRRSQPEIDLAEDGGRAIVTEEGIAALAFAYATGHDYLRGIQRLDQQFLDVITSLTAHFEVGVRTAADWEHAILTGFATWNQLREHNGGVVTLDATNRTLTFVTPR